MADAAFLDDVMGRDGVIEPERLSGILRVTKSELALASGLSRDSVSKSNRLRALPTQKRLREVTQIINRVLP
jgi:hypothetical protein